jgi:hypothetical protein
MSWLILLMLDLHQQDHGEIFKQLLWVLRDPGIDSKIFQGPDNINGQGLNGWSFFGWEAACFRVGAFFA